MLILKGHSLKLVVYLYKFLGQESKLFWKFTFGKRHYYSLEVGHQQIDGMVRLSALDDQDPEAHPLAETVLPVVP